MCFETAFPVFAAREISCRLFSRVFCHAVVGGVAHIVRMRAKSCAEDAEHGSLSHGGGRERVSFSLREAKDVDLTKTCIMTCSIRTTR